MTTATKTVYFSQDDVPKPNKSINAALLQERDIENWTQTDINVSPICGSAETLLFWRLTRLWYEHVHQHPSVLSLVKKTKNAHLAVVSCKYCEELHDLCYNQHFCICRIFFIHAGISIHVPSALSKHSLNAVLKGNSGVFFFFKPRPYIYMSWCVNYTDSPMFFGGWDSERLTTLRKGFLWLWTFFFVESKDPFCLAEWEVSLWNLAKGE